MHLPEGDIGAGYSHQWRHFGADYKDCFTDYTGQGCDQLMNVIKQLKEDPFSRRIIMNAWNAAHLDQMALPPCHVMCQFYVRDCDITNKRFLSCHMYQRSVDTFLGLCWNIMSYATLTYILAQMCDMYPDELIISTGDTHIYLDHLEQVQTQLTRTFIPEPVLVVNNNVKHKSIKQLDINDFEVIGYFYHPAIKAKMSV